MCRVAQQCAGNISPALSNGTKGVREWILGVARKLCARAKSIIAIEKLKNAGVDYALNIADCDISLFFFGNTITA